MLVGQQAWEAILVEVIQPGVDGIRVTRPEQTGDGDGVRGMSVSDFEQGGTAFADIGSGVMVAVLEQLLTLIGVQC